MPKIPASNFLNSTPTRLHHSHTHSQATPLTDCAEQNGGVVPGQHGIKPDAVSSGHAHLFTPLLRYTLSYRHSTDTPRLVGRSQHWSAEVTHRTPHLCDHNVAVGSGSHGDVVVQDELGHLGGLPTPSAPPDDHHRVLVHCRHNVCRTARNGQGLPSLKTLQWELRLECQYRGGWGGA